MKEQIKLWEKLQQSLQANSPLALAFSGGLDSRFVAHVAQKSQCDIILFHAQGAHVPTAETNFAKRWSQERGLVLHIYTVDVCSLNGVKDNSLERCYYCKKELLSVFLEQAKDQGRTLCDGTNADDLHTHRPGLRALKEYDVFSPLAECGMQKSMVRTLAENSGLDNAQQKASPCLLTRLNYGMHIEHSILKSIERAEDDLHRLGLEDFRLRLCPEVVLQSSSLTIHEHIIRTTLEKHGFHDVCIIEDQNVSGFFDKKNLTDNSSV